jgi:hypothetical protein
MEQQVIQTKTETKAEKIRTLLAQKIPVKTIAATIGTTPAVVYGVRARMLKTEAKKRRAELRFQMQARKQAKAQELASSSAAAFAPVIPTIKTVSITDPSPLDVPPGVRISERTGKPVRKYTKGKSPATLKKSIAERGAELRRLTEEAVRISRASAPAPAPIRYIEVEVPQPHYNLTWKQRFTALFFGRV